MIIKETIKKEISLTIDDIKDLILRDLNIEEKEGVIVIIRDYTESVSTSVYDSEEVFAGIKVTISEEVSKQSIDRRLKNIDVMIEKIIKRILYLKRQLHYNNEIKKENEHLWDEVDKAAYSLEVCMLQSEIKFLEGLIKESELAE